MNRFVFFVPLIISFILSVVFVSISGRLDLSIFILFEVLIVFVFINLWGGKSKNIFWVVYNIFLGTQVASIYSSGYYIIPLTLSNAGEYSALGIGVVFKLSLIVLSFIISSFSIFFIKSTVKAPLAKLLGLSLLVATTFSLPMPLHVFADTASSYYSQLTYKPDYNYPEYAKKYFKVNIWNEVDAIPSISRDKQNVIVIFTEGMSSAIIDKVNKKQLGITPNIDALYDSSIVFNNYYNHTAATFRGLRGQLTSAYQYKDGINGNNDGFGQITNEMVTSIYQKRLISLPEILNKYDYKTYFLSSTDRNSTLNTMLKSMPFTKVYGMGDFKAYQDDRMTDKQTFSALKTLLSAQQDQPFFIGVYPSGTHHGRDSPDLKYKDGKNPYYNKFYNYDAQLGDFIKYFNGSKYAKNTTLIITADHSTFPTPEFKESFGIKANYFVDQIPLIIYRPGVHPEKIDAKAYNSLSLAPTVLQLVGINNEPNYFLGCSLFDKRCNSKFSNITAIGDAYYHTLPSVYPYYNVSELPESLAIKEFYNISG